MPLTILAQITSVPGKEDLGRGVTSIEEILR